MPDVGRCDGLARDGRGGEGERGRGERDGIEMSSWVVFAWVLFALNLFGKGTVCIGVGWLDAIYQSETRGYADLDERQEGFIEMQCMYYLH